jgi:hypothetical protein
MAASTNFEGFHEAKKGFVLHQEEGSLKLLTLLCKGV